MQFKKMKEYVRGVEFVTFLYYLNLGLAFVAVDEVVDFLEKLKFQNYDFLI